jgi:hypothetical protein
MFRDAYARRRFSTRVNKPDHDGGLIARRTSPTSIVWDGLHNDQESVSY